MKDGFFSFKKMPMTAEGPIPDDLVWLFEGWGLVMWRL